MKQITIIIAIIMFALSCAHSPSHAKNQEQIPAPNALEILEKIPEFDDVDTFVIWLEEQPNIRDVYVNKQIYLTTFPPKVVVSYYQNGDRHSLLLAVEPDHKLKIAKPE